MTIFVRASLTVQPHHQVPLFSLQDMRFFQHFLTQCYPHHPLKQEEVWTHEIPCIAHNVSPPRADTRGPLTRQHEFLMHAILGFAASELMHTDPSLVTAAMNHRIKAIKAIKKRLAESSRTDTNYEEANALVATCFALTFQSVSLDDGLAEYMTFIRGIVIVGMQMTFRSIAPVFSTLFDNDPNELLAAQMEDLPLIQRSWADSAVEALNGLKPLCALQIESEYREQLLGIAEQLYVNSFEGTPADPRLALYVANRSSLQDEFEAVRVVDAAAARHVPGAHQHAESDHGAFALALDCAVADYGVHHGTGAYDTAKVSFAAGKQDGPWVSSLAQVSKRKGRPEPSVVQPVADVGRRAAGSRLDILWSEEIASHLIIKMISPHLPPSTYNPP